MVEQTLRRIAGGDPACTRQIEILEAGQGAIDLGQGQLERLLQRLRRFLLDVERGCRGGLQEVAPAEWSEPVTDGLNVIDQCHVTLRKCISGNYTYK